MLRCHRPLSVHLCNAIVDEQLDRVSRSRIHRIVPSAELTATDGGTDAELWCVHSQYTRFLDENPHDPQAVTALMVQDPRSVLDP